MCKKYKHNTSIRHLLIEVLRLYFLCVYYPEENVLGYPLHIFSCVVGNNLVRMNEGDILR